MRLAYSKSCDAQSVHVRTELQQLEPAHTDVTLVLHHTCLRGISSSWPFSAPKHQLLETASGVFALGVKLVRPCQRCLVVVAWEVRKVKGPACKLHKASLACKAFHVPLAVRGLHLERDVNLPTYRQQWPAHSQWSERAMVKPQHHSTTSTLTLSSRVRHALTERMLSGAAACTVSLRGEGSPDRLEEASEHGLIEVGALVPSVGKVEDDAVERCWLELRVQRRGVHSMVQRGASFPASRQAHPPLHPIHSTDGSCRPHLRVQCS